MAEGQQRNQALIRGAAKGLDNFKYEIATELGISQDYKTGYWGNISSRECGAVGGHMVRRMIAAAEQSLISQAAANVSQSFKSNLSASLGNAAGWESDTTKSASQYNANQY